MIYNLSLGDIEMTTTVRFSYDIHTKYFNILISRSTP